MKHRLTKWIVSQNDTTVFVIEASMPEARAINQYVLYGKGYPKKLLANLHFWTWNTEEVLNLLKWMRTYNLSGKGQIEFWGCDMQYPKVAADSVRAFINRANPSYLAKLNHNYQLLSGPDSMRGMSQHKLDTLYRNSMSVFSHLRENMSTYLNRFDNVQVEWAIQNARIVEQSIARFLGIGKTRDKSMAENIKWIVDHHSSNSKTIVWAHNDHIGRGSNNMGHYLNIYFENKYRPVAFAFGEGNYSAVLGPTKPVKSFPAPAPMKGSVEYVLHQLDVPKLALDLRRANNDKDGKWLASPKLFRSIGSVAEDLPYKKQALTTSFDALIYFDHITASHSFGRP
ncbi:MAG: erythromycin esterase family protein [Balneolaceae bacterium]|jgi:erythromycin esterase